MATRGKAIVRQDNSVDLFELKLPPYAVRYLQSMCQRERQMLGNMAATGVYSVAVDAAYDALNQIEAALP